MKRKNIALFFLFFSLWEAIKINLQISLNKCFILNILANHLTLKKCKFIFSLPLCLLIFNCKNTSQKPSNSPLFTKIKANQSQLYFNNKIVENDSLNYHNFPYIYMGGGVAIGDFNNDNLSDIFLTGNMVENKLYLNKGNLQFEDITQAAQLQGDDSWYTGVTLVDINNDGWLDIYLSISGKSNNSPNQLWINQGDLTFVEKAKEYGIADASPSIQAAFFDYDKDGDLDLFVANYPLVPLSRGNRFYAAKMKANQWDDSGHLYQNNGGIFKDVTQAAGLQNFGLTLGLSTVDFNLDGLPDLYLSNDFNVPDYFYLNQGDGTFREVLKQTTGHTSMFGMGIDVADFNNDGLPDLIQADMTPEDYKRAKVNMASMSPKSFWEAVDLGFHYQYMQNSLQLNQGITANKQPYFSEISRFAGISNTDWSWATLFADLDNDGWKDIFISNGMKRDVNDNDFNKRTNATTFNAAFKTIDIQKYPSEAIENYVFKNNKDLTFTKRTKEWGLAETSFANGAAYGDLDNDGDLDLLINNIDKELSLFENNSNTLKNHYLKVRLYGTDSNKMGIGSKIKLRNKTTKQIQTQELILSRGFQSSVESIIHFGLGDRPANSELTIIWPDGKEEIISVHQYQFDTLLHIDYKNASYQEATKIKLTNIFEDITTKANIDFKHQEDVFNDYTTQPLLPHKYSTLGPGLAIGDVNNDGLEDFFIGGAKGQAAVIYTQTANGTFEALSIPSFEVDKEQENTGAHFFDADNDGDQDLYIVCGGNYSQVAAKYYQDRFYVNINGQLIEQPTALPSMLIAGQNVLSLDFNKDERSDLLVAGRNIPNKYPFPPSSFLLKNNGKRDLDLKFIDVTMEVAPFLKDYGMISTSLWVDLDNDEKEELILAGEWMPIAVFGKEGNVFVEKTAKYGFHTKKAWWYSLASMDIDLDGDMDLIAGNLGLNYKYKASAEKPFKVYAADFDKNGNFDIVLSMYKEGRQLPLRGKECSSQQIPVLQSKFKTYRAFAEADLHTIYGKENLDKAMKYEANTYAHYWIENKGNSEFVWHQLPAQAQLAPMQSIVLFDYNGDEYLDVLSIGAMFDSEVETPRADAGLGCVLQNEDGKGFRVIPNEEHQLFVLENYTKIAPILLNNNRKAYLFAGSDERLKLFTRETIQK